MMKQSQQFIMLGALLITLFTACLGHAEEGRLSVRTLAVEKGEMPMWHIASDGETYKELKWPDEQPSPAILSTAGKELLLYSKETNAAGAEEFKVVRKLAIPEAADEVLIVAWPVDGDEKVGLLAVATDLKKAGPNDWVVINTSKQEVTLRYDSKSDPLALKPCEAKPLRIDSQRGDGNAVIAQTMMKGEWKTIYSTYWAVQDKQRSLALFYDKNNRVTLRRLIEPLQP